MHYWGDSNNSRKIVKFICVIFLLTNLINGSNDCNPNDSIVDSIFKEIVKAKPSIRFADVNWKWPSCSTFYKNILKSAKVDSNQIENSNHWINCYIRSGIRNYVTETILINMKKGDDWFIGNNYVNKPYIFNGYFQFIDSRALDIVFTTKINIVNKDSFSFEFIKKINQFIDVESFSPSGKIKILIREDDGNKIEGEIECSNYNMYCKIPQGKDKVLFWTNGEIVILSIPKIRLPFRDVFGYDAKWTIGGIPRDDKRSYKRFGVNVKFDYEKEMQVQFPWVADSLKKWRKESELK